MNDVAAYKDAKAKAKAQEQLFAQQRERKKALSAQIKQTEATIAGTAEYRKEYEAKKLARQQAEQQRLQALQGTPEYAAYKKEIDDRNAEEVK